MKIEEKSNEAFNDNVKLIKIIKNDKHGRTKGKVEGYRNFKNIHCTKY